MVTLQDLFLAKAPGRGDRSDARSPGCSPRSLAQGLKPHFLEKMASERGHPASDVLPGTLLHRVRGRPSVRRPTGAPGEDAAALPSLSSAPSLPGVAAAGGPKITSLDTSGYATVRATVVTTKTVATAPALTENGVPVGCVPARSTSAGRRVSSTP